MAVTQGEHRHTYRDLGRQIHALAGTLRDRYQVRVGDTVALLAPNVVQFVTAYFAIVRVGAAVLPIDPRTPPHDMQARLADARVDVLAIHQRFAALLPPSESDGGYPRHRVVMEDDPLQFTREGSSDAPRSEWQEIAGVSPDTIAELMYTSGTTGIPKLAMRSHRNVRAAARNSVLGFGYREEDVIAIAMPLSHSSALNSQMVPFVQIGGTIVLIDGFEPASVIAALQGHAVTCMRLVPSMLNMLLTRREFCAEHLPAIRLLVNSSAPVRPEQLIALSERFPGVQVMDSYGLTEASTCTVLTDDQVRAHAGSVGRPIAGVALDVVDESGLPVAVGAEGEVRIRGEHVFHGYRNGPDETAKVLRDGWLWTGDMGHLDEDGLLHLHGRKSEVIYCSGYKVHPETVEECIRALPQVKAVAVVGVPHRLLGEVVKACVVPHEPGLKGRAISEHCARMLPSHAVPFVVEFVEELPTGMTGKVLRRRLKAADGGGASE